MGAAAIFETPHVFTASELAAVRYEQSADVMVFTHLNHPIQRLRRYSHYDWRWDAAPIGIIPLAPAPVTNTATIVEGDVSDGYVAQPYQYGATVIYEADGRESQVTDGVTVLNDLSLKGNFNTITVTAVTGAREYRVYAKRSGAYGYIGTIVSGTTFIDNNISADYSDAPPLHIDPFEDSNNPSVVTFHEGRMAVGRTLTRPNAVYLSQTDDLFNFDRSSPQRATDAIALALRGRRINAIQHLVSMNALIALTSDAPFAIGPADQGTFTIDNLRVRNQGSQGAGPCRPELIVDVLFYTASKGSSVRTLGYQFEVDGYKGNDITVFAPHLFSGFKILEMAWCEYPSGVLWMVRDDGKLLALTWQAEQQVWGWTLCETDGFVESLCTVSENSADVLYAVTRRTVGAASVRMVERLAFPLWIDENWNDVAACVILDAASSYEGEPATTFRGLAYLEGRTVTALADGLVIPGLVVTNGTVTLSEPYSRVTIGLPYESRIRTLPVVAQIQGQGSSKARPQAPANVVCEVLNTRGAEYGKGAVAGTEDVTEMYPLPMPEALVQTYPEGLYTGTFNTEGFPSTDWREALVTMRQRDPLPMVLLSVNPDVIVSG